MRAGLLRHRITIQRLAAAGVDAAGHSTGEWEVFATAWADIRWPSGMESIRSSAVVNTTSASIRIRYRADVQTDMRIVDEEGVVYEIRAVLPDTRRREYVDLVSEVVR